MNLYRQTLSDTIQYNTIPLLKFQEQESKAFTNKSKREYVLYILGKRAFDQQVIMPFYGLFGHKTKPHDLKNLPMPKKQCGGIY